MIETEHKYPPPQRGGDSMMNLTKRLSTYGAASRRKAAEMIKQGLVTVNGKVETNPATQVGPSDKIRVNGSSLDEAPETVYIMLDKPRGYVCTNEDIHAKKKAVDLIHLRKELRLFSAGRLDKDSEGLIIFTNDGEFAERLMHPRNEICKTYALSAEHAFTPEELQQMVDGIMDEGEELFARDVYQMGPRKYLIVLNEGRNREIRRMAEVLGNGVKRLERIAIGNLKRGMLKPGEWRFMNRRDIAAVLGLDEHDAEVNHYSSKIRKTFSSRPRPAAGGHRPSGGRPPFRHE